MKKILPILAITMLTACATAQNLKNSVPSSNPEVTAPGPVSTNQTPHYASNIRPKAVRDLEKKFKTGSDVDWQPMDYGFRAKFTTNGISYRVDYDKKGNRMDMVRTYDEKHLAPAIKSM